MDINYRVFIDIFDQDQTRMIITTGRPGVSMIHRDKEMILEVPGALYSQKSHQFTAPLTWSSCIAAQGIFGERLIMSDAINAWAWNEWQTRIEPTLTLREAVEADGDHDLYGFQRAGVQFLTFARQALLTDDMGLGKTVQTIRTLAEIMRRGENPFPVLVIAPNGVVLTWETEFHRWWPNLTIQAVPGGLSAEKRRQMIMTPAHIHIVSFETARIHSRLRGYGDIRLRRCIVCDKTLASENDQGKPINQQSRCENCRKELNRHWETIIVDEAHRLKDPEGKTARAVWALREGSKTFKIEPTTFAYGLTGTPIDKDPSELWSALHFLRPGEFKGRQEFVDRWCERTYNAFGSPNVIGLSMNPARRAEFYQIVNPIMRRIPKSAVLSQLPPKIVTMRYVSMTPKQRAAYDRMNKEMIAWVDTGLITADRPVSKGTRKMQFASAYATVDDQGNVTLAEPSCKTETLIEILADMDDKPAVVFAVYKQLINLAAARLDKEGISYGRITGDESPVDREIAIREFQAGRLRVMLCTLGAGSEGISLTRADTVIFIQRSWRNLTNRQGVDRLHRIGSEIHEKINVIHVVAVDTVETEDQLPTLALKEDRLQEIVRDDETLEHIIAAEMADVS